MTGVDNVRFFVRKYAVSGLAGLGCAALALLIATVVGNGTFAKELTAAATPPVTNATPDESAILLFDAKGSRIGVMFRFAVQDIDKVEENRALAEKLLPGAIRYADLQALPMIAIRAYETPNSGTYREYGYVWQKNATTGLWTLYIKKTL
jgi:hypothetical protein